MANGIDVYCNSFDDSVYLIFVLEIRLIFGYNMTINIALQEVMIMSPVIKPSSELRKNYNSIAEICRANRTPVFLTRNGAGDTVLMDIETYSRREEDLAQAERLLAAERARLAGAAGYTVDEFRQNMREAIQRGASYGS